MSATLYFSNPDTQAVQKVVGVISQPTVYTLGDAEEIYKAPHRDIFEEIYADELGGSVSGSYNYGGTETLNLGTVVVGGTGGGGGSSSTTNASKLWAPRPIVVDSVPQHSDERVHAAHRQDRIKLNYWKIIFSEASGQPTHAMLSIADYPDFSPSPPGWWTDPNP